MTAMQTKFKFGLILVTNPKVLGFAHVVFRTHFCHRLVVLCPHDDFSGHCMNFHYSPGTRKWCVGEICTARSHKVRTVACLCIQSH